jgi:hypothetical protein
MFRSAALASIVVALIPNEGPIRRSGEVIVLSRWPIKNSIKSAVMVKLRGVAGCSTEFIGSFALRLMLHLCNNHPDSIK